MESKFQTLIQGEKEYFKQKIVNFLIIQKLHLVVQDLIGSKLVLASLEFIYYLSV